MIRNLHLFIWAGVFLLCTSALLVSKSTITLEQIKQEWKEKTSGKNGKNGKVIKWEKKWGKVESKPMNLGADTIWLVIHSTSVDANADAVCNSMGCRRASWHWTVDDSKIINSYPMTYQSWHIGDLKPLTNARNKNSISIEMCQSGKQCATKVVLNTAVLITYLVSEEGLKHLFPNAVFKLISHSQATGKACPLLINGETISMLKGIVEKGNLTDKQIRTHNHLREQLKKTITYIEQ